jgi:hypothetical protein
MIKNQSLEMRRLILAKKMFLHGCDHASGKDEISRMFAIHHFDNTIELVLKCAAIKSGITLSSKGDIKFKPLIDELIKKYQNLPSFDHIIAQHFLRNDIQHQGNIPSFEDAQKYKIYTEEFLKEMCDKTFGIPFDKIYLSQLIHNKKLRVKANSAERAYEKNDFKRCMKLSEEIVTLASFDIADIYEKAGLLTGYWTTSKKFSRVINDNYANQYKNERFYKPVKELSQALLELGMSATGMQFLDEYRMDFLKFMITLKKIDELSDDELKGEAQYSLNFVTSLILKWQEEKIFQEI